MSWWNGSRENTPNPGPAPRAEGLGAAAVRANPVPPPQPPPRVKEREPVESPPNDETAIAAGMVIEGKIQGTTNLRIAGTFRGDLTVQGTLILDQGGLIVGNVSAKSVVLGGEIQGNISATSRVAILATGILRGDLKAELFVAEAGAQMAGRADFGTGSGG